MRSFAVLFGLAAVLLQAAGCPGKVEFSELEKFGPVRSAVWLDLTLRDPDWEYTSHVLVLSNQRGLCEAYQTALPELARTSEHYYDLWSDYDYQDLRCEMYEAYWTHLAESLEGFYGAGDRLMMFYLLKVDSQGGFDWDIPPENGVYHPTGVVSDMETFRYFDMAVNFYDDNPFRLLAQASRDNHEFGCDGYYAFYDSGYDVYEDFDDAIQTYSLVESDRSVRVVMKGDDKVKVDFDAEIADEEHNGAGTAEGSFTATHCPVTIESDESLYLEVYFL